MEEDLGESISSLVDLKKEYVKNPTIKNKRYVAFKKFQIE
jgi:hypothetical protein